MVGAFWKGDACSLADAMRNGAIAPPEALELSLEAITASELSAICSIDEKGARATAESADPSLPFGGLPAGFKELDAVEGWPPSSGSLVFRERVADYDMTMTRRLRAAGVVPVAQTTASELGGTNCTRTLLHGTTVSPWEPSRTPGGSSGGSAAAVAGGLLPIATAADGGRSIRISAGFTSLFGLRRGARALMVAHRPGGSPLRRSLSSGSSHHGRKPNCTGGSVP